MKLIEGVFFALLVKFFMNLETICRAVSQIYHFLHFVLSYWIGILRLFNRLFSC